MKKLRNIWFLVLIHFFQVPSSRSDEDTAPIGDFSDVSFATKQLQVIKLYNNLNCLRTEDKDLSVIAKKFNPLTNLHLYKNPEDVKKYFNNLNAGKYQTRLEPFYISAPYTPYAGQMAQFLDILWSIDDWDLLYKTAAYTSTKINTQQFVWAMNNLLATKIKGFKVPPSYEIFPQMYTPKRIILGANDITSNDLENVTDPEDALRYWRADPGLNQHNFNWNAIFPIWKLNDQHGKLDESRKGELFMYMHHNLVNRYKAERLSNNMTDTKTLVIKEPIPEANNPITLNVDLSEMSSRNPNSLIKDIFETNVEYLEAVQDRIREAIKVGYLVDGITGGNLTLRNDSGNDYLGSVIRSTTESIDMDFYGNLYDSLQFSVAEIGSRDTDDDILPAALSHPEQAMQDPAFFGIHYYINEFNQMQQYLLKPYTKSDLVLPGVDLHSVKIGVNNSFEGGDQILTTYFENFTYDISNSIQSCRKVNSDEKFTATVQRLNYIPFVYKMNVFSHKIGETRGIVRIYMSPVNGFDGESFSKQDLFWNMFEMDRFPITLKFGINSIERSSLESSLTIPTRPGINELITAVNNTTEKIEPYPKNMTGLCGFPNNLLLPRGTKEGMKFRMFVIITSNSTGDYDENEYPQLPFCGNPGGKFPDGVPMGFPFNRKFTSDTVFSWGIHENFKFTDLIVKHEDVQMV